MLYSKSKKENTLLGESEKFHFLKFISTKAQDGSTVNEWNSAYMPKDQSNFSCFFIGTENIVKFNFANISCCEMHEKGPKHLIKS